MELLGKANAIRLRSHEGAGAYLVAHDDKETVGESDGGSSPNAKWVVERVEGKPNVIRLKSCFDLYLTATDGKVDWELICDGGVQLKLKSWGDKLLQANGGPNSISQDEPNTQNWTVNFMRWVGEILQTCCEPTSISHHEPNSGATQNWVFWDVVEVSAAPEEFIGSQPNVAGFTPGMRSESELNFQVADNILAPLPARSILQLNRVSYPFGQLNSPVASAPKKPPPPQVSNPFGQTNSPPPSPSQSPSP